MGSLEHYSMDWNAADTGDVTSEHPAGPSLLAQKMYKVRAAVAEANKAAEIGRAHV